MTPMPASASAATHALQRRTRCFTTTNRIRPTARAFSGTPTGAADPQGSLENVGGVRAGDDELDIVIVGVGTVGLAVACALSNMPLTKHLRVAIIDGNPAMKSKNYVKKDGIND